MNTEISSSLGRTVIFHDDDLDEHLIDVDDTYGPSLEFTSSEDGRVYRLSQLIVADKDTEPQVLVRYVGERRYCFTIYRAVILLDDGFVVPPEFNIAVGYSADAMKLVLLTRVVRHLDDIHPFVVYRTLRGSKEPLSLKEARVVYFSE